MRNALILHGVTDFHEYMEMDFPSPSNAHWLPWLQQKFLRAGIVCQTPELPAVYQPDYDVWSDVFSQFQITSKTIIVAHSAGVGFLLKWMSLNPSVAFDKFVMVAPWLDPSRSYGSFLECALPSDLQTRIKEMDLLYSHDDTQEGVRESKDLISNLFQKTKLHEFDNMGHFILGDMGSEKFEQLWNICIPNLT